MRPPAKKRIESETVPVPADPRSADSRTEALQEKAKLAQHLHAQGVNPVRWTEAYPAPQSDQATFRTTGLKPKDNQFEVGGKLYDWSPAVTATPQQAKAIADAYIAERSGKNDGTTPTLKIEDLVDIGEVPLKHPIGTPHDERPANDMSSAEERTALLRHYAQSGVDPDRAHLGDPVDRKAQERLKAQIEKTLPGDKTEISGLPLFYQGFDDGWVYQSNASTRESEEVQKIRRERVAAPSIAANDDLVTQKVVQHYVDRASVEPTLSMAADSEANFNEKAAGRLAEASAQVDALVLAIEHLQAGAKPTDSEVALLDRIKAAFSQVGIQFDPTNTQLDYLRNVATAIKNTASTSSAAGSRVPLHVLVQEQNTQLAQALAGSTLEWAQIRSFGPVQTLAAAVSPARKLSIAAQLAGPAIASYALGKGTAEVAKKMAEEGGGPNLFSPYADDGGALTTGESSTANPAASAMPPSIEVLKRLSSDDVAEIGRIFAGKPSTFNRTQPVSMPADKKTDLLTSGMIDEIELFGLPIYLADPRGSEQTQIRIDKLKSMVRDKLVECGMTEEEAWGGEVAEQATERAKERFVPRGEGGVRGSRRADLSFKIRWRGKTYIIDINTVDVLKSGSMTKAERIAAEGLRLNRIIRLSINEELPEEERLAEFEGKIGTVPKGKDMTDEDWEAAAKDWVDSFLDCDGPLEADVYLDPESKHPWPGKE